MCIIILWLPILSFVISSSLGRVIGVTGSHIISVVLMLFCFLSLLVVGYEHLVSGDVLIPLFPFLSTGLLSSTWTVKIDGLVLSILLAVILVSLLVHYYSISYMSSDPHQQRFFSYLSLFTGSMILLVTSNSLVQLFVGWELIGISSYLLIGFWGTRLPASQSSLQAFIINRLGDVALSVGVYMFFVSFNSVNFDSALLISGESHVFVSLSVALLLAAIAKSAQLGFHTWLPSAIEGPTPVSALIHAATLVTAGAFLLIRVSPLLEETSTGLLFIGLIGALTALFAGTVGLVQNDLKRVIAFSTCSQMGYLFLAIGLGEFSVALFHLLNHAIFKALLFLSAGVVIHAINDNQDLRRLGGLLFYLPVAYVSLLVGSLSLMALPYLTGFYSKEVILELAYSTYTVQGFYLYLLGLLAAGLTGFYSFRLLSLTFFQTPNSRISSYYAIHSPDWIMILPLIILLILSLVLGYVLKDAYTGLGSSFLSTNLITTTTIIEAELAITTFEKLIPLLVTAIGSFLGLMLSSNFSTRVHSFLSIKWGFDDVLNWVGYKVFSLGLYTSKIIDRGLLESYGPYGFGDTLNQLSHSLVASSTVSRYAFVIVLSVALLVFIPGKIIIGKIM